MKRFKIGDRVEDLDGHKGQVINPETYHCNVSENSVVIRPDNRDTLEIWKESETVYDIQWYRSQQLNKLLNDSRTK